MPSPPASKLVLHALSAYAFSQDLMPYSYSIFDAVLWHLPCFLHLPLEIYPLLGGQSQEEELLLLQTKTGGVCSAARTGMKENLLKRISRSSCGAPSPSPCAPAQARFARVAHYHLWIDAPHAHIRRRADNAGAGKPGSLPRLRLALAACLLPRAPSVPLPVLDLLAVLLSYTVDNVLHIFFCSTKNS